MRPLSRTWAVAVFAVPPRMDGLPNMRRHGERVERRMTTRGWSVYPVRLRDVEQVLYLRVRADEGVIGVGRRVVAALHRSCTAGPKTL